MTHDHDTDDHDRNEEPAREEGPTEPRPVIPPRFRDWGHIYGTQIRTSTVVLVAAFLASVVLYGYTSQRYGIVSPPPARTQATTTTTPEPTWSYPSSSSVSPSLSGSATTPGSGEEGSVGTESGQTASTAPRTIPGLPGVTLPNFDLPTGSTPSTVTSVP
ncbi:hypothetical protein [Gordonia rhizosphera]|uniref:Uncharacterized protein n=1 Tax=Gordonia rhizosphera NBRC 16068 TaxID=1108045 RepID=K6WDV8_9ACTN|nr:hypothetical protein [Gordonia rhizosphera]GAB90357.1 hypothetical protein GORHZ_098_00050 [Gordonia rhizosphera NBRC 16068]